MQSKNLHEFQITFILKQTLGLYELTVTNSVYKKKLHLAFM